MLYFENYLEYFRSVWSDKKYFFKIKYWKYLHGWKAAHKKIVLFENAFNLRGFECLQVTFNEAPIKIFLCWANPYLVQRIWHVLSNFPCDFLQKNRKWYSKSYKIADWSKMSPYRVLDIFFKKFVSDEILIFSSIAFVNNCASVFAWFLYFFVEIH